MKSKYPRLDQLGVEVHKYLDCSYVDGTELATALMLNKINVAQFHEYFGVQTCCEKGPYPWDVEAVLERMMSGRLTGTQLIMD